jgi:UrcA family protein
MLRTLSIAALGAVLALPAAAETSVKVDVAGLDAPAAHARIVRAARAACQVELRNSTTFEQYYQQPGCINDAVTHAEADLKAQQASAAGGGVLAGR